MAEIVKIPNKSNKTKKRTIYRRFIKKKEKNTATHRILVFSERLIVSSWDKWDKHIVFFGINIDFSVYNKNYKYNKYCDLKQLHKLFIYIPNRRSHIK